MPRVFAALEALGYERQWQESEKASKKLGKKGGIGTPKLPRKLKEIVSRINAAAKEYIAQHGK